MIEVAITGMGVVSCLGSGVEKVKSALARGASGIHLDRNRAQLGFRGALTGMIDDFTPMQLERKRRRTITDFGLWAYAAALEALESAGWSDAEIKSPATGLILGNDSTTQASFRQVDTVRSEGSTLPIGAGLVFQALNSTVTMNLGTLLGTMGASWTVSGACASGSLAIGQAASLIETGRQDRVLCGGVQEITWESVASFDATNAFSTRHDHPQEACRPFDAERDGLVPSGGAAIVALERFDEAARRNATILGKVLAHSFSSDGQDLAVPTGAGLARCMEGCLRQAGVSTGEVDYICAHATSTPVGDAAEARAIAQVFGSKTPWVSSTKSMTGHEMWMAGAAQVVYSVIMGQAGFIAPNINFKRQEDGVPRLKIATETIDQRPAVILCNSAGFGGTNSCLLLNTVV